LVSSAAEAPAVVKASPSAATGLVSIQTASVDELAGVQGLNLKIAKEIIKARPFTSLAELTRVRGIGDKTVARLKALLTV
jgi:competence ComEA-like helix-hairpin-helix protein